MLGRFFERAGPADKGDVPVVEETFESMGAPVGLDRNLRAAGEVHPSQHQGSPMLIFEIGAVLFDHH